MSNLYIRVRTGFFTNRKTVKLRLLAGDDAFWIPPRLWAYAAENQPDGDMSRYSSEELAMLLGCYKYASSIKSWLTDTCFLDLDGKIHEWEEHAGYHQKYSERASVAAKARWLKTKEKKQKKEESTETLDSDSGVSRTLASLTDASSMNGNVEKRLWGIPGSVDEVVLAGQSMTPKKSRECCETFWSTYESVRRVNPDGAIFWVDGKEQVMTQWKEKLKLFTERTYDRSNSTAGRQPAKRTDNNMGTFNDGNHPKRAACSPIPKTTQV